MLLVWGISYLAGLFSYRTFPLAEVNRSRIEALFAQNPEPIVLTQGEQRDTVVSVAEYLNLVYQHVQQQPVSDVRDSTFVAPAFPGGDRAWQAFTSYYLRYPDQARAEGRVMLRFTVAADGTLHTPVIVRGVDSACDAAALDLVRLMPRWIPASSAGRPVEAEVSLAVSFELR
jgi:TonB family protein